MKIERPDLLEACRQMFGAELVSVFDEENYQPSIVEDNEVISLGTGNTLYLHYKDRIVKIWISEWGGIELERAASSAAESPK